MDADSDGRFNGGTWLEPGRFILVLAALKSESMLLWRLTGLRQRATRATVEADVPEHVT